MPYYGMQRLFMAAGLSAGLIMSSLTGAALFTEQNVILPVNFVKFRKNAFKTIRFWLISFIGNCIGCAFMGLMFNLALAVRSHDVQERLSYILTYKLQHMDYGLWLVGNSFVRVLVYYFYPIRILGNTILGTGVIMGNMSRDVPGKVIAMFLGVVSFVATGVDHCVANIGFFSIGLFHQFFFGETLHVPRLNISNVILWNVVPTGLGNMIGSFVFVSITYSFIFSSNHVVKGLAKQNGEVKKEQKKRERFLSLQQTEMILSHRSSGVSNQGRFNFDSFTPKSPVFSDFGTPKFSTFDKQPKRPIKKFSEIPSLTVKVPKPKFEFSPKAKIFVNSLDVNESTTAESIMTHSNSIPLPEEIKVDPNELKKSHSNL
jgi:formate transporter